MKGIVATGTVGITGKGKAKSGLTLICLNKRGGGVANLHKGLGGNRWEVEETHIAET